MTFKEYQQQLAELGLEWVTDERHVSLTFENVYIEILRTQPPQYTVVVDNKIRRTNSHDTIETCQHAACGVIDDILEERARAVERAILSNG